ARHRYGAARGLRVGSRRRDGRGGRMSAEHAASAALHARVQRFAEQSLRGQSEESFEQLALAIAQHQRVYNPVLERLWAQGVQRGRGALEAIPAVPADAFRLGRVACFDASEDQARFVTSGTTGGSGVHPFRSLDTYRQLSVVWGRQQLLGGSRE